MTEPTTHLGADNPWATAPDSAWAAEWAQIALAAGRIELGYQLSKLAVHAHRFEQEGRPRHAEPSADESQPIYLPAFDAAQRPETLAERLQQPPITLGGRLAQEAAEAIHVTAAAAVPPVVVPNGRCIHRSPKAGIECHAVAFWDPVANNWTHMDTDLDDDHEPQLLLSQNGKAGQS